MAVYRFLADVTVVFHLAYASFIVLGLVAILVGIWRRWSWVRNFWFRLIHLLMIGLVAAEAGCGIKCPLTVLETYLRKKAGEATYTGSFIGNMVHEFLFFEAPEWVFSTVYILFFLLVAATFVWARPRWPFSRRVEAT